MDSEEGRLKQSAFMMNLELNSGQLLYSPNESIEKTPEVGFNPTALDPSLLDPQMIFFNEPQQQHNVTNREYNVGAFQQNCDLQREISSNLLSPEINQESISCHELPDENGAITTDQHDELQRNTLRQGESIENHAGAETVARQQAREAYDMHLKFLKFIRYRLESLFICENEPKTLSTSYQKCSPEVIKMISTFRDKSTFVGPISNVRIGTINEISTLLAIVFKDSNMLMKLILDIKGALVAEDMNDSLIEELSSLHYKLSQAHFIFGQRISNVYKILIETGIGKCSQKDETVAVSVKPTSSGRKRKLSAKLVDSSGVDLLPVQEKKHVERKKEQHTKLVKKISKVKKTASLSSVVEKSFLDEPQSERVVVKILDSSPDRITNPLLEVPQGSLHGEPNLVASEFLRLLPIYFPDPDTFPLSYYASLLGISLREDISLEEQKDKWSLNDSTHDPWYSIPPLGSYRRFSMCNTFDDFLDNVDRNEIKGEDDISDYIDPIWLRLLNDRSWYAEDVTRKSIDMKHPIEISQECIDLAKSLGILENDLEFRVGDVRDAMNLSLFHENLSETYWLQTLKLPNHAVIIVSQCNCTQTLAYIHFDFSLYQPKSSIVSSQDNNLLEGIMKIMDVFIKPRYGKIDENLLIVLLGLALEDARRRVAWAIVDVNSSMLRTLEKYFRMSYVGAGSIDGNALLVCDLDKCNYRFAFCSKIEGDNENESLNDFRMILQLPYRECCKIVESDSKAKSTNYMPDAVGIVEPFLSNEEMSDLHSDAVQCQQTHPRGVSSHYGSFDHDDNLRTESNTENKAVDGSTSNNPNFCLSGSSVNLDQRNYINGVNFSRSQVEQLNNNMNSGETNAFRDESSLEADNDQKPKSTNIRSNMLRHVDHSIYTHSNISQNSELKKICIQVQAESIISPEKYTNSIVRPDKMTLNDWNVLRFFKYHDNDSSRGSLDFISLELKKLQQELKRREGALRSKVHTLMNCIYSERLSFEIGPERTRRKIEYDDITEYSNVMKRKLEAQKAIELQLQEDENAVCDICYDGESSGENRIIFCDSCDLSVHQLCYNIDVVPKGDYFCRPCLFYKRDSDIIPGDQNVKNNKFVPPIVCELCPRKQGAFFQIEMATDVDNSIVTPAKWVHVLCAKWLGLGYVAHDGFENSFIEDVQSVKDDFLLSNISCCLCQGMRGAYNKCQFCEKWMHVTCARSSGLCNVNHGFNHLGPIESTENRKCWTVACPDHSDFDDSALSIKVSLEDLIALAKTFPPETKPKPPPKPFNKMNAKERSEMLNEPQVEFELIDHLSSMSEGSRCEICDITTNGEDFIKCSVCNSVVHSECVLCPWKRNGLGNFICTSCSAISTNTSETISKDNFACHMCIKRTGTLVECFAKPTSMKRWKNGENNPLFKKSLFGKRIWCHPICGLSTCKGEGIYFNQEKQKFDCQMIILSHGFGHVKEKVMCSLCGRKDGIKNMCSSNGSCERKLRFHATCAREAGFQVDVDGAIFCFFHMNEYFNLRAFMEDMIEPEKKRSGDDLKKSNMPMSFECAAEIFNNGIRVLNCLGWAWQWAKWWVEYPSSWEPLIAENQDESKMSKEELRIVDSTPESRLDDIRRSRLIAFSVALRNREYDKSDGDDRCALKNALMSVMNTRSLVGPLTSKEKDFFVDWLGRVYRSKSQLLGFGENKIPVAETWSDDSVVHYPDKSPKFELGARNLPGSECSNVDKDIDDLDLAITVSMTNMKEVIRKRRNSYDSIETPNVKPDHNKSSGFESSKGHKISGSHDVPSKTTSKRQNIGKSLNSRIVSNNSTEKYLSPPKKMKVKESGVISPVIFKSDDDYDASHNSRFLTQPQQQSEGAVTKKKRGRPAKKKIVMNEVIHDEPDELMKIPARTSDDLLHEEADRCHEELLKQEQKLSVDLVSQEQNALFNNIQDVKLIDYDANENDETIVP